MIAAIAQRIRHHAGDWAARRQGRDGCASTLGRRRIYILPSRFGFAFALLVFAMLLGSLNYSASLGFALTFLLGGLGLVAMHHCHGNLLGTELRYLGAQPVFLGQRCVFRVALINEASVARYELALALAGHELEPVDLGPGETKELRLGTPSAQRGWQRLGRFTLGSRHPGNLFRAWSWLNMEATCLVYPALAAPGRPLPASEASDGRRHSVARGDVDFAGLRAAVPGDAPHRIAWKAYARTDQLLVKEFAGAAGEPQIFAWEALPDLQLEQRLSQLARWCVDAVAEGRGIGLRLPRTEIPVGFGESQLHECLKALALFELDGPQ
jgi:uncharacterized protein (DUF58 family)